MRIKHVIAAISAVTLVGSAIAYAGIGNPQEAVEFHPGHSHEAGGTIGAPSHSGGTDKFGCHNASVPYHCH
jgi:hypothetical protein